MPILLDLFSGSLSWSKAFAELPDWECISIDNDPKFTDTTIMCDVLEWEVPERLHGSVDVVTIGVPCTAYSTANKKKTEEAQEATRVLWRRAFEIADLVLKPNGVFVAENPSRTELTGCKSRPIGDMEALIRPGMYKTEVNYCRYSEPPEYVFSWKKTLFIAISTCYEMVSNPGFARHEDSGVASVLSTHAQAPMRTLIGWRSRAMDTTK